MALARAAIRAGRRRWSSHCSSLARNLESGGCEIRCFSSAARIDTTRIGTGRIATVLQSRHSIESRTLGHVHQSVSMRFYSSSSLPPHQAIGMPSLSPTMTQGNIVSWKKKEGDQVVAGDVLCEIETDKATVDMECMEDGFLAKILYPEGSKDIKVGEIIAVTVDEKGDLDKFKDYKPSAAPAAGKPAPKPEAPKQEAPSTSPTPATTPAPSPSGNRIIASPNAKKFAFDNQVSLEGVEGTGPGGRIVRADVENLLKGEPRRAAAGSQPSAQPSAQPSSQVSLDFTDIPNTQIRRIIAQRLLQSKQTIPHYYLTVDVQVDKLVALRTQLNNKLGKDKNAKKLSINDFVLKAAALALRKVPECNSSWTEEYIRQFHNVNISVAVQTERGLVVPVVKDADKKGLGTISDDVRFLADKARQNSLKPTDYEGGTFTVSNLGGPFGIKQFCAIINPPQSCILAVGTTDKRVIPAETNGEFSSGTFMSATLSCDHRVVDGAIGAHWLGAFKGYLEDPMTLLL